MSVLAAFNFFLFQGIVCLTLEIFLENLVHVLLPENFSKYGLIYLTLYLLLQRAKI